MGLPNILSRYISFDMNENNILTPNKHSLKIRSLETGVPQVPNLGLPPAPPKETKKILPPQVPPPAANTNKPKIKLSSEANLSKLNAQSVLIQPHSVPPAPPPPPPPAPPKTSGSEPSLNKTSPTVKNKPSLFFILLDLSIFLFSSFLICYFLFLA